MIDLVKLVINGHVWLPRLCVARWISIVKNPDAPFKCFQSCQWGTNNIRLPDRWRHLGSGGLRVWKLSVVCLHNNAIVARCILDTNIALWDTRTASAPPLITSEPAIHPNRDGAIYRATGYYLFLIGYTVALLSVISSTFSHYDQSRPLLISLGNVGMTMSSTCPGCIWEHPFNMFPLPSDIIIIITDNLI